MGKEVRAVIERQQRMKGKTMAKRIVKGILRYQRCLALMISFILVFGSTAQAGAAVGKVGGSAESASTINILLIGNSYTKYNNMPGMLRKICTSKGQKVKVTSVAKSMASLSDFASRSTSLGKKVRRLLKTQKWDYVVLQERHYYPLTDISEMLKSVRALQPYIEAAGAKTALYMTWAPEKGHSDYQKYKKLVSSRTEYQKKITRAYEYVADKTDAIVIPVGLAFENAQKQSKSLSLIAKDKSHPTKCGSYLAACTIYAALFDQSPVGASTAGVKKNSAKQLQQISWKVCKRYIGEASGISQFY